MKTNDEKRRTRVPPPTAGKPTHETEKTREVQSITEYMSGCVEKPSLSFSVSLQEKVLALLPKERRREFVSWRNHPPRDSANFTFWRLARLLKWDRETCRYSVARLRPVIHAFAEDMQLDPDDAFDVFADAHKRARVPLADGLLASIASMADAEPFDSGDVYQDEQRRRLLSCCWHLARRASDGVFYVSCRDAAQLAGTDKASAGRWLRAFVRDGFLHIEKPGDAYHATRYRLRAAR